MGDVDASDSALSISRDAQITILIAIGAACTCFVAFIAYTVYRFASVTRAMYEEFQLATGSLQTLVARTRRGISWLGWGSDDSSGGDKSPTKFKDAPALAA